MTTSQIILAARFASEFCAPPRQTRFAPGTKEGAERRRAQFSLGPRNTGKRCRCLGRGSAHFRGALAFRRSAAALARANASTLGSAPVPCFLRPGLAGVTARCIVRVGEVVVPVGRGPRAARERSASPRAGTALAPPTKVPSRRRPRMSKVIAYVTLSVTTVKYRLNNRDITFVIGVRQRTLKSARRFSSPADNRASIAPRSMRRSRSASTMAAGVRRAAGPRIFRTRRVCWPNIAS